MVRSAIMSAASLFKEPLFLSSSSIATGFRAILTKCHSLFSVSVQSGSKDDVAFGTAGQVLPDVFPAGPIVNVIIHQKPWLGAVLQTTGQHSAC